MTCRCGRVVAQTRYGLGHVDRLPRGRGHYVRLSLPTSAPAVTGHGAEAGGAVERVPARGLRRSEALRGA